MICNQWLSWKTPTCHKVLDYRSKNEPARSPNFLTQFKKSAIHNQPSSCSWPKALKKLLSAMHFSFKARNRENAWNNWYAIKTLNAGLELKWDIFLASVFKTSVKIAPLTLSTLVARGEAGASETVAISSSSIVSVGMFEDSLLHYWVFLNSRPIRTSVHPCIAEQIVWVTREKMTFCWENLESSSPKYYGRHNPITHCLFPSLIASRIQTGHSRFQNKITIII